MAISDPALTRSDAFRSPADRVDYNPQPFCRSRVFHRSRIPRPDSPNVVNLNQVADLSSALDFFQTPRRPPSLQNFVPGKRQIKQPSNYKQFGETGQR